MGTINTTLSRSKSGANADEILVRKWDAGWGRAVLKEATGLQEGESTAWCEGGKDSKRIVTIFCVVLSDVGIA